MSCVKYVCYGACRVSRGLCVGVLGSFLWVVFVCGLGVPVSGLGADCAIAEIMNRCKQ